MDTYTCLVRFAFGGVASVMQFFFSQYAFRGREVKEEGSYSHYFAALLSIAVSSSLAPPRYGAEVNKQKKRKAKLSGQTYWQGIRGGKNETMGR